MQQKRLAHILRNISKVRQNKRGTARLFGIKLKCLFKATSIKQLGSRLSNLSPRRYWAFSPAPPLALPTNQLLARHTSGQKVLYSFALYSTAIEAVVGASTQLKRLSRMF